MPLIEVYRTSDRLLRNRELIEQRIFEHVQIIFNFMPTITLYDLTKTDLEGIATLNPAAKRGRSKEERCKGEVLVVRYSDDFVIGYEQQNEAQACLEDMHLISARRWWSRSSR